MPAAWAAFAREAPLRIASMIRPCTTAVSFSGRPVRVEAATCGDYPATFRYFRHTSNAGARVKRAAG
jgi:hypothetical protein